MNQTRTVHSSRLALMTQGAVGHKLTNPGRLRGSDDRPLKLEVLYIYRVRKTTWQGAWYITTELLPVSWKT